MLIMNLFQFIEKEERITQLEYTLEETQSELHNKLRNLSDIQDNLNELKVEYASVREQKNSALKEVRTMLHSKIIYLSHYYLLGAVLYGHLSVHSHGHCNLVILI